MLARRSFEARSHLDSRGNSELLEHPLRVMARCVNADAERRRYFGVGRAAREKPCDLQLTGRESRRLSLVFIIDCDNADISPRSCIIRLGCLITRYHAISVSLQIEEHVTDRDRNLSSWTMAVQAV